MKALFRSLSRNLEGFVHGFLGRAWFRIGRTARARFHFERALALRGDDFGAYIRLGRLAYRSGDYAAWRREYEHARRTCPERFARVRHPFDPIEPRAAGLLIEETGARATWRAMRWAPSTMTRERAGDDFSTEAERCAFRDLEPITAEEIGAADLDDLARRLLDLS